MNSQSNVKPVDKKVELTPNQLRLQELQASLSRLAKLENTQSIGDVSSATLVELSALEHDRQSDAYRSMLAKSQTKANQNLATNARAYCADIMLRHGIISPSSAWNDITSQLAALKIVVGENPVWTTVSRQLDAKIGYGLLRDGRSFTNYADSLQAAKAVSVESFALLAYEILTDLFTLSVACRQWQAAIDSNKLERGERKAKAEKSKVHRAFQPLADSSRKSFALAFLKAYGLD